MIELLRIRRFLEAEITDFPTDFCEPAAVLIQRILGYDIIVGDYKDKVEHWCNYDPNKKRVIDLTLDQFEEFSQPIYIANKLTLINPRIMNPNISEEIDNLVKPLLQAYAISEYQKGQR